MEPAAAAAEYWATLDDVAAAADVNRRHERACKVLKDHMAGANLHTYKGISMVTLPAGSRVNLALLVSKLKDPALIESCREPSTRRTLIPKRRPKLATAALARVAVAKLKPVTGDDELLAG